MAQYQGKQKAMAFSRECTITGTTRYVMSHKARTLSFAAQDPTANLARRTTSPKIPGTPRAALLRLFQPKHPCCPRPKTIQLHSLNLSPNLCPIPLYPKPATHAHCPDYA